MAGRKAKKNQSKTRDTISDSLNGITIDSLNNSLNDSFNGSIIDNMNRTQVMLEEVKRVAQESVEDGRNASRASICDHIMRVIGYENLRTDYGNPHGDYKVLADEADPYVEAIFEVVGCMHKCLANSVSLAIFVGPGSALDNVEGDVNLNKAYISAKNAIKEATILKEACVKRCHMSRNCTVVFDDLMDIMNEGIRSADREREIVMQKYHKLVKINTITVDLIDKYILNKVPIEAYTGDTVYSLQGNVYPGYLGRFYETYKRVKPVTEDPELIAKFKDMRAPYNECKDAYKSLHRARKLLYIVEMSVREGKDIINKNKGLIM